MSTDTSSALDQPTMTAPTPKPPRDKVMRIATMTKQLLDEVHTQTLDTAGLKRLRTIDTQIIGELLTDLTPDLREELATASPAAHPPHRTVRRLSDAELRVAHAQLAGWLQGLLNTAHTALSDPSAVLAADWITGQETPPHPLTSPPHRTTSIDRTSNRAAQRAAYLITRRPRRTIQRSDQRAKH